MKISIKTRWRVRQASTLSGSLLIGAGCGGGMEVAKRSSLCVCFNCSILFEVLTCVLREV